MKQPEIKQIQADVVVIGAGPAGLTAGIYGARSGVKTYILAGKRTSKLVLDYPVENYPGFISVGSQELLRRFREHAEHFGAEIIEADALDINLSMNPKYILTKQQMLEARSVIVATGRPSPAKNQIKGEARLVGMGVSYCATCDGPFYRGKKALAVGNTDEAAEDILALHQMGVAVEWVTGDGNEAKVAENLRQEIKEKQIPLHPNGKVLEIVGENRVEEVVVDSGDTTRRLPVEGVFVFRDLPFSSLYDKAGLEIDHRSCLLTDPHQKTNLQGVFAAGDVTCGGMQIVTAAGEGARAAISALKYLRTQK
jgi:thioredoxin reductase (NADPH)